jgi:hypothetical protein
MDYWCCDDCFDPRQPEYTLFVMPGIRDCEVCGKQKGATHWQIGELPENVKGKEESNGTSSC